jgi:hypothetical protein
MCLGNGNMDTQSVFHSSEVNVILDSKQQTKEMMDSESERDGCRTTLTIPPALFTNQNTMQYGGVGGWCLATTKATPSTTMARRAEEAS